MMSDVEEKVVGQGGKGDHILCGSFVEVEGVMGGAGVATGAVMGVGATSVGVGATGGVCTAWTACVAPFVGTLTPCGPPP